ncbi:four helix bundle protein [bacterium (Candidatus Howlettbacteria) CG_4_10_14_0_8_um_filter_40_9]|nr:MAG: four helix bundle protein [bacterium (Candidatus Howlettbacteria) CG_4_10_14_0_8_um_filter_40_9]
MNSGDKNRKEIKDFDDLEVYQLARELTVWIYKITSDFPDEEKFGIISQIRRAITSVGANIAEGFGRFHYKENVQFCRNARGSLTEVKHFMISALDLGYIDEGTDKEFIERYDKLKIK